MKLCDLIQAYTATSGGIRTYINEKRRYLAGHTDWDHCLIYPGETDEVIHDGRFTTRTVAAPFIPGCEPYRIAINIDRVVACLREEAPDIIEVGGAYLMPWAAFRYRKRYNPDVVIAGFYHTDYPTAYVAPAVTSLMGKTSGHMAKSLAARYARHVYNQCDTVIAPAAMFQKNLQRYGVRSVRTIPLGVDTTLYHPSRHDPALRHELGAGGRKLMLIYVGRLDSEKKVNVLVEALDHLPGDIDPVLVLIGDGPRRNELESAAPARGRVIVLPYLTDKLRLAGLLASADIYVTAGPYETFGLSIIEAQASGLPVVGVDAGALRERVVTGTGLLGPVGDPAAMAANIVRVLKTGAGVMGEAARKMIEEHYSWDRTFQRILAVYQELLPASQSPAVTTGQR